MTVGPEAPHGLGIPAQPLAQPGGAPPHARRAAVWPRIAAYLVDASLATLTAVPLTHLAGAEVFASNEYLLSWLLAWIVVRVGIPHVTGESPGKLLGGLRTVDDRGERLSTALRALREILLYPFHLIPFAILADAVAADRPGRRSLRDRMAGTYVLQNTRGRGALVACSAILLVLVSILTASALYQPASSLERQRAEFIKGCTSEGGRSSSCECMFDRIHAELGGRRIDEISRADTARLPPDAEAAFDDAAERCGELAAPATSRAA